VVVLFAFDQMLQQQAERGIGQAAEFEFIYQGSSLPTAGEEPGL
jgi:hypothetical protein